MQWNENLERNIISYGLLEAKGFGIAYRGKHRVVADFSDGHLASLSRQQKIYLLFETKVARANGVLVPYLWLR